ncbi:hypothetical protein CNYM01_12582 [Colletotrichum nymphaeae SA-01]|uniref:Transmembrane protein n=1 Tax=Colletotrichum nymphaeae SA-01 TaxID=1460502 RepID=A0A135UA20_9PEZI|nr:hypothetical protein CNYM01_12582 [Colletotrichum nymphaeae SA-01]
MYWNRSESDVLSIATDLTTSSDDIGDDFNREVSALFAFIKVDMRKFKDSSEESKQALGRPQTARHRTFVVVCGERGANRLNMKLESLKRHPLKFWKKRFWRELRVVGRMEEIRELVLIVSSRFDEIYFKMPHNVKLLMVLRAETCSSTGGQLCINRSSTFRGTKIYDWQSRRHKGSLFFGPNVVIPIDPRGEPWTEAKRTFERDFTVDEKQKLRRQFEKMRSQPMDGNGWLKEWKGIIASVMGVIAGGSKLVAAITASTGGVFVHYQYGIMSLKVGAAFAKGSMIATAAGPAIFVGVGVAAAVYFIPWETLLDWLGDMFSWARDILRRLWSYVQDWLANSKPPHAPPGGQSRGRRRSRVPKPMWS